MGPQDSWAGSGPTRAKVAALQVLDASTATDLSGGSGNGSLMAERLQTLERSLACACEERAALARALEYERQAKVGEVRALQLAQAALVRSASTERQVKDGEIKALRAEVPSLCARACTPMHR